MGRNAKIKKNRREERQRLLDESWSYFTSRSFLNQIRKMILDSGSKPESCICCTKVLVELGSSLGVSVDPLTVETTVYNPVFAEYIAKHGFDPSHEEMAQLGEDGGRFVVLGARDRSEPAGEDRWPGHLVALLRAKGKPPTVIDLSIDQANRPKKDILITEPLIFGVPDGFITGEFVATGQTGTKAGSICFVYRAYPEDKSFEDSPDWRRIYDARAHDGVPLDGLPLENPE